MDWFSCLGGGKFPFLCNDWFDWLAWCGCLGCLGLIGLIGLTVCFDLFPLSYFVLWFLFGCACVVWLFLCFVSLLNCSCCAWMLEARIFKHSGWFLSCMVVYWFFFKPLAYLLKNLTLLKTASWMNNFKLTFFCFIWPLLIGRKVKLQDSSIVDFGYDIRNPSFTWKTWSQEKASRSTWLKHLKEYWVLNMQQWMMPGFENNGRWWISLFKLILSWEFPLCHHPPGNRALLRVS